MKKPMSCTGCFHNAGMDVCMVDHVTCKSNGYSGYRFRDFVDLAEYVTRHNIRCFEAYREETGGIRLEER